MEHESNSDSYGGEMEDIYIGESRNDTYASEVGLQTQIQAVLLTYKLHNVWKWKLRSVTQHKTSEQSSCNFG